MPKATNDTAKTPTFTVRGEASVLNKPGAVTLAGFPLLVYAPRQHGDGIRTEDRGVAVADIAAAAAETPDYEKLAAKFGTTPEHVAQAVRYATEAGFLANA